MALAPFQLGWSGVRDCVRMTGMLCIGLPIFLQPLFAQNPIPGSIDSSFAGWTNRRPVRFILTQSNDLFVAGAFGIAGIGTNCVRLNADGVGNPSFAPTNASGITAMALEPDGKVLAGYKWWGARRFLADGNRDSSFNFVAPAIYPWVMGGYFWTTALVVQPDGRILIAGYRIYDSRSEDERYYWAAPHVYRLLADGASDSTFRPYAAPARAFAVLPGGQILVVGDDLALLHADGSRDTNFVAGPFSPRMNSLSVRENDTFDPTIRCFAIQPDGRILVGGSFTNVQGHQRTYLARLLRDGRLDLSFNPPPFTGDDFAQSRVTALALQADGRILVGGALRSHQWSDIRSIVRLHADGSVDSRFRHVIEGFDDDEDGLGIPAAIVIQDETRAVIGGEDLDSGDLFRIHLGDLGDEFRIICFGVQSTSVTICWRSEAGRMYYIAHKPTLTTTDWTPASGGIVAQGNQASWTGLRPPGSSAFYSVVRLRD